MPPLSDQTTVSIGTTHQSPYASPWQVLALAWLRGVTEAGKTERCVKDIMRAAVLGAGDKSAEVREAGNALAKQALEVGFRLHGP